MSKIKSKIIIMSVLLTIFSMRISTNAMIDDNSKDSIYEKLEEINDEHMYKNKKNCQPIEKTIKELIEDFKDENKNNINKNNINIATYKKKISNSFEILIDSEDISKPDEKLKKNIKELKNQTEKMYELYIKKINSHLIDYQNKINELKSIEKSIILEDFTLYINKFYEIVDSYKNFISENFIDEYFIEMFTTEAIDITIKNNEEKTFIKERSHIEKDEIDQKKRIDKMTKEMKKYRKNLENNINEFIFNINSKENYLYTYKKIMQKYKKDIQKYNKEIQEYMIKNRKYIVDYQNIEKTKENLMLTIARIIKTLRGYENYFYKIENFDTLYIKTIQEKKEHVDKLNEDIYEEIMNNKVLNNYINSDDFKNNSCSVKINFNIHDMLEKMLISFSHISNMINIGTYSNEGKTLICSKQNQDKIEFKFSNLFDMQKNEKIVKKIKVYLDECDVFLKKNLKEIKKDSKNPSETESLMETLSFYRDIIKRYYKILKQQIIEYKNNIIKKYSGKVLIYNKTNNCRPWRFEIILRNYQDLIGDYNLFPEEVCEREYFLYDIKKLKNSKKKLFKFFNDFNITATVLKNLKSNLQEISKTLDEANDNENKKELNDFIKKLLNEEDLIQKSKIYLNKYIKKLKKVNKSEKKNIFHAIMNLLKEFNEYSEDYEKDYEHNKSMNHSQKCSYNYKKNINFEKNYDCCQKLLSVNNDNFIFKEKFLDKTKKINKSVEKNLHEFDGRNSFNFEDKNSDDKKNKSFAKNYDYCQKLLSVNNDNFIFKEKFLDKTKKINKSVEKNLHEFDGRNSFDFEDKNLNNKKNKSFAKNYDCCQKLLSEDEKNLYEFGDISSFDSYDKNSDDKKNKSFAKNYDYYQKLLSENEYEVPSEKEFLDEIKKEKNKPIEKGLYEFDNRYSFAFENKNLDDEKNIIKINVCPYKNNKKNKGFSKNYKYDQKLLSENEKDLHKFGGRNSFASENKNFNNKKNIIEINLYSYKEDDDEKDRRPAKDYDYNRKLLFKNKDKITPKEKFLDETKKINKSVEKNLNEFYKNNTSDTDTASEDIDIKYIIGDKDFKMTINDIKKTQSELQKNNSLEIYMKKIKNFVENLEKCLNLLNSSIEKIYYIKNIIKKTKIYFEEDIDIIYGLNELDKEILFQKDILYRMNKDNIYEKVKNKPEIKIADEDSFIKKKFKNYENFMKQFQKISDDSRFNMEDINYSKK